MAAPASFAGAVEWAGLVHAPFVDAPQDALAAVFAGLSNLPSAVANPTVMREVFGRLDAQAALPALRELVSEWRPVNRRANPPTVVEAGTGAAPRCVTPTSRRWVSSPLR